MAESQLQAALLDIKAKDDAAQEKIDADRAARKEQRETNHEAAEALLAYLLQDTLDVATIPEKADLKARAEAQVDAMTSPEDEKYMVRPSAPTIARPGYLDVAPPGKPTISQLIADGEINKLGCVVSSSRRPAPTPPCSERKKHLAPACCLPLPPPPPPSWRHGSAWLWPAGCVAYWLACLLAGGTELGGGQLFG